LYRDGGGFHLTDRSPRGARPRASETHLERWLQRNTQHDAAIIKTGRTANLIVDAPAALSVATWANSHAAQ
jgi:hypothetical protein